MGGAPKRQSRPEAPPKKVQTIENNHCKVLGLALGYDWKNTMPIGWKRRQRKSQIATTVWNQNSVVEVLGLAPCHHCNINSRYVTVISHDIRMYCGRFVGPAHSTWMVPLQKERKKKGKVLHLFRCYTHTRKKKHKIYPAKFTQF